MAHFFFPKFFAKWFWYLGLFEQHKSEIKPISGLCYWLIPPNLNTLTSEPFRAFVYITYMLSACAFLSRISICWEDSEENPQNVISDLLGPTKITMGGVGKEHDSDEALKREVARLVPVAAILGGLTLGVICILSDLLGVVGGAQGILIASSIMHSAYESWSTEQTRTTESRWSYVSI